MKQILAIVDSDCLAGVYLLRGLPDGRSARATKSWTLISISVEECESAVTSCYQAMTYGGWWQINTVWLLSEMCRDDGWMGNTSPKPE